MFYIFYPFSLYKTRMQILDISICSGLPCDIMVILSILLPCGKETMMMICIFWVKLSPIKILTRTGLSCGVRDRKAKILPVSEYCHLD